MSDRVLFATQNQTGPAPSFYRKRSSGFQFTPHAVAQESAYSSDFIEQYQNLTLSKHELTWFYWRVKKWRVHGTATRTNPTPPGGGPFIDTFDFEAQLGDVGDPDEDLDIDRERRLSIPRTSFTPSDEEDDGGPALWEMFTDSFGSDYPILQSADGADYKPYIRATVFNGFNAGVFASTQRLDGYDEMDVAGDRRVVIDGTDYPLTFYWQPLPEGYTYTLDFIVEPLEYWPYANSEGFAIFDTASGDRLRDPLS